MSGSTGRSPRDAARRAGRHWLTALLAAISGLAAVLVLLRVSEWGPTAGGDAVSYVTAARNLLGGGLTTDGVPCQGIGAIGFGPPYDGIAEEEAQDDDGAAEAGCAILSASERQRKKRRGSASSSCGRRAGRRPVAATERIALRRATATVREGSIVVRPARGQLLAAAAQLAIAAGAVAAIALFLDRLPYWLLAVLLLAAVFLGPVAALGFVFAVFGSSVVVDGRKRAAHWQQGFLGLGIGTTTSVPFGRIGHVAVSGDHDDAGADGEPPEVVTWLVELVRDDGRRFEIGAVLAARPLAAEGHARARRLAAAVGALAEAEVRAAPPPADADPGAEARPRRRRFARARRRRDGERG